MHNINYNVTIENLDMWSLCECGLTAGPKMVQTPCIRKNRFKYALRTSSLFVSRIKEQSFAKKVLIFMAFVWSVFSVEFPSRDIKYKMVPLISSNLKTGLFLKCHQNRV